MLMQYMLWLSDCTFVRLSVTSRNCTKMAKRKITQTTPYQSPGSLVKFSDAKGPGEIRIRVGVTPNFAPSTGGVCYVGHFRPISRYI